MVTRVQIRTEWPIISAALGKLGCRLLGLNWRLTPAETQYVLTNSGAQRIDLRRCRSAALAPAFEGLPIKFAVSIEQPADGFVSTSDLIGQPADEPRFATGNAAADHLHVGHDGPAQGRCAGAAAQPEPAMPPQGDAGISAQRRRRATAAAAATSSLVTLADASRCRPRYRLGHDAQAAIA